MGMTLQHELLLQDACVMHCDVRLEDFAGRLAFLDGVRWRVVSLDAKATTTLPLEMIPILRLTDPKHMAPTVVVSQGDLKRVRFPSADGEHKLGPIKHGIMRLVSSMPRSMKRLQLQPGQQFESRLRHRELLGPFLIHIGNDNLLTATKADENGDQWHIVVNPEDVAPRYVKLFSLDFGASFNVDSFLFHEDKIRTQSQVADPSFSEAWPAHDPLFGILPEGRGGTMPDLTNGANHLRVFERFIRNNTIRPLNATSPRRLTILNLSMSNQGDASCILDALVDFRRHNPTANICIVVSKLGPTEFQGTPEFHRFIDILTRNQIQVNDYTSKDAHTRQVMHGKAIVIDQRVLFSTGAVMDTRPIDKADFALELPGPAAIAFSRYVDEAILGSVTPANRAELAAELAVLGVVINDPVLGLTYVSRAQDALIRRARHNLLISMSELVDPEITKLIIQRATSASKVNISIQVRELDPISARLLATFLPHIPNLRVEDSSGWEPRPHWNIIVADGEIGYVGSSYLWTTQRNMIHQGRSFENGVVLADKAVKKVCSQIEQLRYRYLRVSLCDILSSWRAERIFWSRYNVRSIVLNCQQVTVSQTTRRITKGDTFALKHLISLLNTAPSIR